MLDEASQEQMRELTLKLLVDEHLEVRLATSLTLTAFLHSNFIQTDNSLIVSEKLIEIF